MKMNVVKSCFAVAAIGVQISSAQFNAPTMTGSYLKLLNEEFGSTVQTNTLPWNAIGATSAMVYSPSTPTTAFTNSLQGSVSVANSGLIQMGRAMSASQTISAGGAPRTTNEEEIGVTFTTSAVTSVELSYNYTRTVVGSGFFGQNYDESFCELLNLTDSTTVYGVFNNSNFSIVNSPLSLAAGKTYLFRIKGKAFNDHNTSAGFWSYNGNSNATLRVVPEPTSLIVLFAGAAGLVRKRRQSAQN